jgi:hypothetical protein
MQQLDLTAPCVANVRRAISEQNDCQQYRPPASTCTQGSIICGEAVEVARTLVNIARSGGCALEDVHCMQ